MVRNYKKKESSRRSVYSREDVLKASIDIKNGISIRQACAKYGIPLSTLYNLITGNVKNPGQVGRSTALPKRDEIALAQNLATLMDFGLAFNMTEMRLFFQQQLNRLNKQIPQFKENLPGVDWAYGFLKRHRNLLTSKYSQITRKRSTITEEKINKFFSNLKRILEGVPQSNIITYGEINLINDPKSKLMIYKNGIKQAEKVINKTNSSPSVMFSCTPTGDILPQYIVYKAKQIQDSWILGGPLNAKYSQTSSGWFNVEVFIDWLRQVVIPYVRRLPKEEPKILLGDNIPSYISFEVVNICEENNIRMVFLPPNSTHLLQPLDVAVYGPMEHLWRKILTDWKLSLDTTFTTLPNWCFPKLLLKLINEMEGKWLQLISAGFKASGIIPFDPEHVLSEVRCNKLEEYSHSEHLLTYLEDECEMSELGRNVQVVPDGNIFLADLLEASGSQHNKSALKRSYLRCVESESSNNDSENHSEIENVQCENIVKCEKFEFDQLNDNQLMLVGPIENETPHHYVTSKNCNIVSSSLQPFVDESVKTEVEYEDCIENEDCKIKTEIFDDNDDHESKIEFIDVDNFDLKREDYILNPDFHEKDETIFRGLDN